MGFAAEVQHSLAYLRDHPDYPALVPRRIPYEFASELRDTLLKEIRQKELDVGILYENYYPLLVSTDRFAEELQRIYEPYFKIGLKPGNDLKVFLLDYLSGILGIVPIQQFTDEQSYLA